MHGTSVSVRPVRGFSLGAKFVGLTAALILLLSFTAFISLRNSNETAGQIKAAVEFAIPAYGALARSHIRSLEQAVELRRSLLLMEDPAAPDDAIAGRMQAFRAARMQFDREFADAERLLLEEQRLNRSSEGVASALQSLREQLAQLKTLAETYENETDGCLAAIAARSLSEARRRLGTIDSLRQE